jgi:hypothetical protein
MPESIPPKPRCGWGSLSPDAEISDETLAVVRAMLALPRGQAEALMVGALRRELELERDERLEPEALPDLSNVDGSRMVLATSRIWNLFYDVLGLGVRGQSPVG